jgi:large repetitive protein
MRRVLTALFALVVVSCGAAPNPSGSPIADQTSPRVDTPPQSGRWDLLQPMSLARLDFTATLMAHGRVLIVGGRTRPVAYAPDGSPTAQVEIFDPATKRFSAAASLGVARAGHSATLLNSGKVLVAGGDGGGLGTAEIYDPASDRWTATAPMNYRRTDHAAARIAGGKVLVTGGSTSTRLGISPGGSVAATLPAEIYDPATDHWSTVATPAFDRPVRPTATVLKDGRVLVVGGQYMWNSPDEAKESSEIYDPTSNAWTATTPEIRTGARQFHSATLLASGQVLIAGGMRDLQATGFAVVYDPTSNSWSQLPNMAGNRCGQGAGMLSSGRVVVVGGGCGWPDQTARAEEFDPGTNRWYSVASLANPRGSIQLVALPNGGVLAAGGMQPAGSPTAVAELFTP